MIKDPSFEELKNRVLRLEKTERQLRIKLDESQQRNVILQSARDVTSIAILWLDRTGTIININRACADRFDMTCEQVIGTCAWDLFPQRLVKTRKEAVATVFNTGKPYTGEDERQGIWNEYHIKPVARENGQIKIVMVESFDITRLRESDARLKTLLRSINDIVWATSLDGKIHYINPAAEKIYGRRLDQIYSDPGFRMKMVHPDDRENVLKEAKVLLDKGSVESQYRIIRDDGQIRWLSDKKNLVCNKEGDPVQVIGITTDVTKEILISRKNEKIMLGLGQRLKELDCIHKVTNAIRLGQTLDQIFKEVAALVPAGFQNSESICCRLGFKKKVYVSQNFTETAWKFSSDILLSNQVQGSIDIFCLKEPLNSDQNFFSKEEQNLVKIISHALAEACEHHRIKEINSKIARALNLHSLCNKAIVHSKTESDLLNHVCRVIVENGNYKFAWIGFAGRDEAKSIYSKAQYGFEKDFVNNLNITWADTKRGQSPVGRSIREQRTILSNEISSDPNFALWKEKAMGLGYISSIALPLIFGHEVFGALGIYAAEKNAFRTQEITLLEELANDLAYGIMATRSQEDLSQAEKILRAEHGKLQGVLNGIGDSVYIANKDYIIEFQNSLSRSKYGNLNGKKCYQSIFQLNEPCEFCCMQKTIENDCVQQVETNSFNQKTYDIVFSPFQDGTGETKTVVVKRDITGKKRLQAEVIRRGHLAALGELAAGVAHEINNPVTGIISIAEILTDKFQALGGDRNIPERIIHEGERISEIVKNLLSFARDKKEEHSPVHIHEILNLSLELVGKQIAKDGIHLSVNIPSDIPKIKARSQEIQQVFLNIISNARYALQKKYPDPHENKIFEINGSIIDAADKKYVRLIFHDRGVGIAETLVDRLADPFFSTKPQGEGTGLGLSISHGIIKNHGGRLLFASKEGEYTKVIVDLPTDNGWSEE